jgi:ATP-dependent RNA helicase DeaD
MLCAVAPQARAPALAWRAREPRRSSRETSVLSDRIGRGRRKPSADSPHSSSASKSSARAEPLKPTTEAPNIESFREWPLAEQVQAAIEAMGISKPTPVQKLAIGPVLEGRDVIAKAETGTGKTLAFGAPMMSKIEAGRATVLGLVLCPTRELAQQVCGVLEKLGAARGVKTALVVGGEPMPPQINALKAGAQVVVGTPGRVIDLYGQRFLSFPWTEFVVLDEADEMLEIGFIDDVRKILSYTPEERQTLLFSATYPTEVLKLARESTRNPVEIATAAGIATVKNIDQSWIAARREDRALLLTRIIEQSAADDVFLVFCDRRTEVDQLFRQLGRLPFSIKSLHGGYDQAARFRVMSAFRTGEVKALIATDVAARGLDVHQVTHVINFAVPRDASTYTHRIGRTGRAGRDGTAITIVGPEHVGRWHEILRDTKWEIREDQAPDRSGRQRVREERHAPRGRDEQRGPERGPERGEGRREPRRDSVRRDRGDEVREAAPEVLHAAPRSGEELQPVREDTRRRVRDDTRRPARDERGAERRDAPAARRDLHARDAQPAREANAPRREPNAPRREPNAARREGAAPRDEGQVRRDAPPAREPQARPEARPENRSENRPENRHERRPPPRHEPRAAQPPTERPAAAQRPERAAAESNPAEHAHAPRPRRESPAPARAAAAASADGRPKREMSTRERLRLEREQAQGAAPVAKAAAKSADAPASPASDARPPRRRRPAGGPRRAPPAGE